MKIRIPVMLKVHDADVKEHEFGPVIVEIERPEGPFAHPGDAIMAEERAALEYLVPDMSCDVIEGAARMNAKEKI